MAKRSTRNLRPQVGFRPCLEELEPLVLPGVVSVAPTADRTGLMSAASRTQSRDALVSAGKDSPTTPSVLVAVGPQAGLFKPDPDGRGSGC
jgi:hypothetical protein